MEKPRNSLSEKAEQFLMHELHREVSVTQLAEVCGTSERSLLAMAPVSACNTPTRIGSAGAGRSPSPRPRPSASASSTTTQRQDGTGLATSCDKSVKPMLRG